MDHDGSFGQWTTRVRDGASLEKRVSHGCGTHGPHWKGLDGKSG